MMMEMRGIQVDHNTGEQKIVSPTPEEELRIAEQAAANAMRDRFKGIRSRRDAALKSGVVYNGETYHTDDRFVLELSGMALGYLAGTLEGQQRIHTMDNKDVMLGRDDIEGLYAAILKHRQAVYARSWNEMSEEQAGEL